MSAVPPRRIAIDSDAADRADLVAQRPAREDLAHAAASLGARDVAHEVAELGGEGLVLCVPRGQAVGALRDPALGPIEEHHRLFATPRVEDGAEPRARAS